MMLETEALFYYNFGKRSCTVVIGETVLFIGGHYEDRQISQLSPLGLIRIGTLPFSFISGTCLVMDNLIFLGFPDIHRSNCWSR